MSKSRAADLRAWRARKHGGLLPYQEAFLKAVSRKNNRPELAALSVGRGNGKTFLCGEMLVRALRPSDDPMFVSGSESVLVSASRPMAALTLEAARLVLGDDPEFRWRLDGVEHLKTRTRCRVLSSDHRRGYGLGASLNLAILDEPGAFAPTSGERLWMALLGSLGKNSNSRIVACGTLAPGAIGGWWQNFIEAGSGPGKHVQLIQGSEETWRDWDAVLKANPCTAINPNLVRTLKREHDEALQNDRAASAFMRFRMNINAPEVTHAQPVLTPEELERVYARPVPPRTGRPIIGCDLGAGRSWSACASLWPDSGRVELWVVASGDRSLETMETEDQQVSGAYREMAQQGGLIQDPGKAVPGIAALLERVWEWAPSAIIADAFRLDELRQIVGGRVPVVPRSRTYQEAGSDIQSLRSRLLDSDAGVAQEGRGLLRHALDETSLVIGNGGNVRLLKRSDRRSRDDCLSALLLASGHAARRPAPVPLRGAIISRTGQVTWL